MNRRLSRSNPDYQVTAFGETRYWKDWLSDPRCVVKEKTLFDRLYRRGADPVEAMTTPPNKGMTLWGGDKKHGMNSGKKTHFITAFGETKTISEWMDDPRCKVERQTLYNRVIKRGMDPEAALTTGEYEVPVTEKKYRPTVSERKKQQAFDKIVEFHIQQADEVEKLGLQDLADSLRLKAFEAMPFGGAKYRKMHERLSKELE